MTKKYTILRTKSEITELLDGAIEHHGHCETARGSVVKTQQLALWHAWQAGIRLNSIKALVARGVWVDWLELNFCKPLKVSLRTAQLYMKIDSNNAHLREEAKTQRVAPTEADLQVLKKLKFDTIRKYAFNLVPKKHESNKDKDIKLPRFHSFLNIVNEYNRLKHRHECGLQEVDFVEAREETAELHQFLQWLHGESPHNPWTSAVYRSRQNGSGCRKAESAIEVGTEQVIYALK